MGNRQQSYCRHVVLAAFCFLVAIAYLSRNCIGVFAADAGFLEDFATSKPELSGVMSAFLWAYAALQIPCGWLGQRYGSRSVLTACTAICGVATGCMGLAETVVGLCLVQTVIGAAQAGMVPNAMRSVADWLPIQNRGFASGMIAACMQIGAAAATAVAGILLGRGVPWQQVVAWFAIPALLWSVAFFVWFRNRPEEHSGVTQTELDIIRAGRSLSVETADDPATRPATPRTNWRGILSCSTLWAINGQQFFRAAGYIFFATWFPTFLKETYHVSISEAGPMSSLPPLAILCGSLLGGVATDWLLRRTGSRAISRQSVAIICLVLCALLILSATKVRSVSLALTLITCGTFFSGVAGPCSYAQTIDVAGQQVPVVFGLMNMMGNIGAAICPPIVTWLAAQTGQWSAVLYFFGAVYLCGAACWLFVKPNQTVDG